MITQERLKELFQLDEHGRLIRKSNTGLARAGTSSSAKDRDGYLVVGIDKKQYRTHRMVWMYQNGAIPYGYDIDHINRVKDDNRIENLRCITHSENLQNKVKCKNNKSGFKGVWKHTQTGKFVAVIEFEGKRYHIGCFPSPEDASMAYEQKASELHKYKPE
jgi:hypothetical protein